MDTVRRFDDRADDYVRFRPSYPAAAIDHILDRLGPLDRIAAADGGAAAPHPNVAWVGGTAEATGLGSGVVDLVLVAQAFHWFRPPEALAELARILKPSGRLAIMWNRRSTTDPLTAGYRQAILDVGGEIAAERMPFESGVVAASSVFSPVERAAFPNAQRLDLDGLIGRARSASYVPKSGEAGERLLALLRDLHARHADRHGLVSLIYETEVFLAAKR